MILSDSVPASPSSLPVGGRQVPVSLLFLTIFPPCPRPRILTRRPQPKLSPLALTEPYCILPYGHHLYRPYALTGARYPQKPFHHRAHTSPRTRRSLTRLHSCGVSTGTHSTRWIQQGCAHASSRSTSLGIYSRNASLMCVTAPTLMAVYASRRGRWASACSQAWKRSAGENILTPLTRTGGARDLHRYASCEGRLKSRVVRDPRRCRVICHRVIPRTLFTVYFFF